MAQNKFNFGRVIANLKRVKNDLPRVLANDTKNFFVGEFNHQEWDGKKWLEPKRKLKKGGSSRNQSATLVQSGRLRRAVVNSLQSATFDAIKFKVVDVPYAKIHNEGGTIEKGERSHVLNFNSKNRFQKQKTEKQRAKTSHSQKVSIGAHSIDIPKRTFMADSLKLRKIQVNRIVKYVDKIWQG